MVRAAAAEEQREARDESTETRSRVVFCVEHRREGLQYGEVVSTKLARLVSCSVGPSVVLPDGRMLILSCRKNWCGHGKKVALAPTLSLVPVGT